MGLGDPLRRLDDRFEMAVQRFAGERTQGPKTRRMAVGLGAFIVVFIAVARIAAGDPVVPVVLGSAAFIAVIAFTVRRRQESEAATRGRAMQQLRLSSIFLLSIAAYFAFARVWEVAALLVFVVAFFNGFAWVALRCQDSAPRPLALVPTDRR